MQPAVRGDSFHNVLVKNPVQDNHISDTLHILTAHTQASLYLVVPCGQEMAGNIGQ
jgi:hypothetical protein